MREGRITQIENYIRDKKCVSLDELCDKFGVSKNTIRRDVNVIVAHSDIKKIYGGVSVQGNKIPPPFMERSTLNADVKERIGRYAAQYVEDGDVIYVDSGTTTCQLIGHLSERKNVTVITNSLEVINRALPYPELHVIALSGTLNRKTFSFIGPSTMEELQSYNISKAFMAANGVTAENGATQSTSIEFAIKKCVVNRSDRVILMVESKKFGVVSMLTYCPLGKIGTVITEKMPPQRIVESFAVNGGHIEVAD